MSKRSTWVDVLIGGGIALFAISGFLASWQQGNWFGLLFSGASAAFLIWFIIGALRQGLRAPTKLESYEGRAIVWMVLVAVGGLVLLLGLWRFWFLILPDSPPIVKIVIVGGPLLVWLAATLYMISRLRDRSESAAAYKRRVGFKDDET